MPHLISTCPRIANSGEKNSLPRFNAIVTPKAKVRFRKARSTKKIRGLGGGTLDCPWGRGEGGLASWGSSLRQEGDVGVKEKNSVIPKYLAGAMDL